MNVNVRSFKSRALAIFLVIILLLAATGCGKTEEPVDSPQEVVPSSNIPEDLNNNAKSLISDYFSKLFSNAEVEKFTENTALGTIPASIKPLISDQTIKEGEGNPEIGIHLPRYVSINGLTIIKYDILKSDVEGVNTLITSDFIANNNDTLVYFVRFSAKAFGLSEEEFLEQYAQQQDYTYKKVAETQNAGKVLETSEMKVELRFDVQIENKEGTLKVLSATESNIKPGIKNRMNILNNRSFSRLPLLDISKADDGSYVNPKDGEIYEADMQAITTFFTNLTVLDKDRMNLLYHKYNQGFGDVVSYFSDLGITKNSETSKDLVDNSSNFNLDFPYKSLPLQEHMRRINSISNFVVIPHPAYTNENKQYFVNFDAEVVRLNGIVDESFYYTYDYLVSVLDKGGSTIIQRIRLNEYYNVR